MKRLFTLLIFAGAAFAAQAQTNPDIDRSKDIILGRDKTPSPEDRDIFGNKRTSESDRDIFGNRRSDDGRNGTSGSYDYRLRQINYEYDRKIANVRNNPDLTSSEKSRVIQRMERERQERIRRLNREFGYGENRGDDDDEDDRYDRKDNGKHKGWTKGKGHQKGKHKGKHDHDD